MIEQPDLFDICQNKHGGVETSVQANESMVGIKGKLRKDLFNYISAQSNGATLEEAADALGIKIQTASARISELLKDNWIFDTGQRRPTTSGRPARVLKPK